MRLWGLLSSEHLVALILCYNVYKIIVNTSNYCKARELEAAFTIIKF